MASSFGEVVFPSSRAFWDGDDEEELENSYDEKKISIKWLQNKPNHMKQLIVVEGTTVIDFIEKSLNYDAKEVCLVEDETKRLVTFHQIDTDRYICIISSDLDVKLSGELVLKISEILSMAKDIVSITHQHLSSFKCENLPEVPSMLRCLKTKTAKDRSKLSIKLLEQPNIIYGVTAGVLSYAEIKELPAILYVLYTDGFVLDSKSAQPLTQLLGQLINRDIKSVTFVGNKFFNKGNLYMYSNCFKPFIIQKVE